MEATTGDQQIDSALARLDDLPQRSLDEQVQVLGEVHQTLAAVLEGANDDPAAGPQPAAGPDETAAGQTATSHGASDPT